MAKLYIHLYFIFTSYSLAVEDEKLYRHYSLETLTNVYTILNTKIRNISCYNPEYTHLNGSCYKYVSTPLNYADANQMCRNDFGYLVDISSSEEQALIWSYASRRHDFTNDNYFNGLYIGLSNINSNGNGPFEWITGAPVTYTNWAIDFPRVMANISFCAILSMSGTWADIPCDWEKEYICKMPLNENGSWISHYLSSSPIAVYVAIPFLLIAIALIFYFASCTYHKRGGKVLKSIKLKLPKLTLPFNKKMRDYRPYDDEEDEVQFNCFGPDESSEHGPESGGSSGSKLRASRVV